MSTLKIKTTSRPTAGSRDAHGSSDAGPQLGTTARTSRRLRWAPRTRTAGWLGLVCAALYSYLMLEVPLGRLDMPTSFVSELSARDQPWHQLFEAFDITSGVLMVLIALALANVVPAGRGPTWGWISLAGFGVSTTLVGSLPMDCAASMTRICAVDEMQRHFSWMHWGHEVFSVTATFSLVASMYLIGRRLRDVPGLRLAGHYTLVALPVVLLLCVPLTAYGLGLGVDLTTGAPIWRVHHFFGVYERIQINLAVGWLAVLGLCLLRVSRRERGSVELAA